MCMQAPLLTVEVLAQAKSDVPQPEHCYAGCLRGRHKRQPVPLQAADIVHIVGIGRNEYIATMNKCKAKKLLWRVNKSIAKEFLPTEPLTIELQPWWQVGVVNLGELQPYSHS